jgi:hypothetical protein
LEQGQQAGDQQAALAAQQAAATAQQEPTEGEA